MKSFLIFIYESNCLIKIEYIRRNNIKYRCDC